MFLNRPQINHREDNGSLPNGQRATTVIEDQSVRSQIVLGDGTAEFDGITTVALTASFADNQYKVNINGNRVLYLVCHVVDLGAIAGLECLIEFESPDFPEVEVIDSEDPNVRVITDPGLWIPSREGASREGDLAAHIIGALGEGNFILRSREEHMHSKKARFSFRTSSATAPNSATHIKISWFHDGKIATVPEQ